MVDLEFPPYAQAGNTAHYYPASNSLMDQVVAMSRALVRAQIKWTVEERKLFTMLLTQIR